MKYRAAAVIAVVAATLTACSGHAASTTQTVTTATSPPAWSTAQARAEYTKIIAPYNADVKVWNGKRPGTVPAAHASAITLATDLHNIQTGLAAGHWPDTAVDDVTNLVTTAGAERSAWLTVAAQTTMAGLQGAMAALLPIASSDTAAAAKVRQDLGMAVN